MTLQELTDKMKDGAAARVAFGNTVKFATDRGRDLHRRQGTPVAVSNDDNAADCTIKMSLTDLVDWSAASSTA